MHKERTDKNLAGALQGKYRYIDSAKTAVVVLTTLFFCLSMTTFDDSRAWFKLIFDLITAGCIIYGLAANAINYRKADRTIVVLTVLYFIARLISYSLNDIPVKFGGAIMLQVFYLIGISKYLYGGKSRQRAAISTFLAFDIGILLLNYYNLYFRPGYVEKVLE